MTYFPQKKVYDYYGPDERKTAATALSEAWGRIAAGGGARLLLKWALALTVVTGFTAYYLFFMPVSFSARVSAKPMSALIGDSVRCDLVLRIDRGAEFEISGLDKALADFTIREKRSEEGVFFRKKTVKNTYILTRYSPGDAEIGQVEVRHRERGSEAWETAKTRPVSVNIGRLAAEEDLDPERRITIGGGLKAPGVMGTMAASPGGDEGRAMDGPVRLYIKDKMELRDMATFGDIGLMALAAAGGFAAAVFVGMVMAGIISAKKEMPLYPPHVAVRKGLMGLKDAGFLEKGMEKEFCSALYSIMTEYVKGRFGIKAGSVTAREFIALTGVMQDLSDAQKEYLKRMATLCDTVKYSGYKPQAGELDGGLEAEFGFVEATKPVEEVTGDKPVARCHPERSEAESRDL